LTCIVGVIEDGEVWLGADGRSTAGDSVTSCINRKMARVGPLLIGVSGMPRVQQIIAHDFKCPEYSGGDVMAYLCREVVPAIRERLTARDAIFEDKDDGCQNFGSHFLIACQGQLFMMDGNSAVYESQRSIECIGSGADVAFGYLLGNTRDEPEQRIKGALRAASEVLNSCGPPFYVEKL